MFIDEMFEDLLVNKQEKMADAIQKVFVDKLATKQDCNEATIKRVENGYQLFRRRHPEYPEYSVRRYVRILSPNLAERLGWE